MKSAYSKIIAILIVLTIVLIIVMTRSTYREFGWNYEGTTYHIYVRIPESSFDYYTGQDIERDISSSSEYDHVTNFITKGDSTIKEIASELRRISGEAGMNAHQLLSLTLAFVQDIPYSYDIQNYGTDDYWAFPVETLHRNAGDCEDKAFLYAALVESMGLNAVILMNSDHAAAGVDDPGASGSYFLHYEVKYYYCETTEVGYEIGHPLPEGFDSAYVIQV